MLVFRAINNVLDGQTGEDLMEVRKRMGEARETFVWVMNCELDKAVEGWEHLVKSGDHTKESVVKKAYRLDKNLLRISLFMYKIIAVSPSPFCMLFLETKRWFLVLDRFRKRWITLFNRLLNSAPTRPPTLLFACPPLPELGSAPTLSVPNGMNQPKIKAQMMVRVLRSFYITSPFPQTRSLFLRGD